jgi:hypothetical protein
MSISFGSSGVDGTPYIKGRIPINATFQQYVPIVDEDGMRIDLADYEFELTFRERADDDTVVLRLSTVNSDGITKTSDLYGDTLLVSIDPADMTNLDGAYRCSFSSKDTSDVVTILGDGAVVFIDSPASFETA